MKIGSVPRWQGSASIGRGIELVAHHHLENSQVLNHLEGRLRRISVIAKLQRAGFEPCEEGVVGEIGFALDSS